MFWSEGTEITEIVEIDGWLLTKLLLFETNFLMAVNK